MSDPPSNDASTSLGAGPDEPSLLRKVLRLTFRTRKDGRHAAALVVLMFGAAMFEAIGIGVIMPFVSLLAHPETVDRYAPLVWVRDVSGATTRTEMVAVFGLVLVLVFVIKNAYLVLVQYAQNAYVSTRQVMLEKHLLETYLRRPWVFHLQNNSSQLVHTVSHEVSQVFTHVVVSLFVIVVEALSVAVVAALIVAIEPVVVPAVGAALGLVSVAFYRSIHRKVTRVGEDQRKLQADMLKWLQQGLGGVKEARILGVEDYFLHAFERSSKPFGRSLVLHRMLGLLPRYVLETTGILALVLATVAMYARGGDPERILPVLGALALAAVRILPSASRILGSVSLIRFVKPSVDSLWTAVRPWPGDGRRGLRREDVDPLPFGQEIRLVGVTYSYPGAATPSLRDVSLTIHRGESIAFIGGSGAGKTTVVDTIIGLLTPDHGHVEVDGVRVAGDEVARWQRAIGYIPQSVYLSDDSVRRNVAFGIDDAAIDEQRVRRALEAARLLDLVEGLPEGLGTFVGERGVRLSGGQRQRIGIARALYLDPRVLVLDEATSALDSVTEREIVAAVERLREDRTVIVIAHRLSTVRGCDRLVMMSGGVIEDVGTWDELKARNAAFRRLLEVSEASGDDVTRPAPRDRGAEAAVARS